VIFFKRAKIKKTEVQTSSSTRILLLSKAGASPDPGSSTPVRLLATGDDGPVGSRPLRRRRTPQGARPQLSASTPAVPALSAVVFSRTGPPPSPRAAVSSHAGAPTSSRVVRSPARPAASLVRTENPLPLHSLLAYKICNPNFF